MSCPARHERPARELDGGREGVAARHAWSRSRSLRIVVEDRADPDPVLRQGGSGSVPAGGLGERADPREGDTHREGARSRAGARSRERVEPREGGEPRGPDALDGITSFLGMRWDDPHTVRLTIRPELINVGGMLSGVVAYALVDYCMASTLWVQTTDRERIATVSISINYVQTATDGEIVCRSVLDRRNRSTGVMRSEVLHEDGRLLATAIGSYSILAARQPPATSPEHSPTPAG